MEIELLEYLALKSGVRYISDLRSEGNSSRLKALRWALEDIPAEKGSVWEWRDAFVYITGKTAGDGDGAEIRRQLLRWLDGQPGSGGGIQ